MDLITTIETEKLTGKTSYNEIKAIAELLKTFIKDNLQYGTIYTICKAYQIGVMQGKHEQRTNKGK